MAAYHILKIDSLIESLTLCNTANGFTFNLDAASVIVAQSGDFVLGYMSAPTDEVRYLFEVISANGNQLELKKKLESSEGVSYDFSALPELQPNVFEKQFFPISEGVFLTILSLLSRVSLPFSSSSKVSASSNTKTAQTIYYGCPGTGKSFSVKEETEGENSEKTIWYRKDHSKLDYRPTEKEKIDLTSNIFRTTFHPDYDYSTFVGAYKPVMKPALDEQGNPTGGQEISYEFIPQVFTNAYVSALRHPDDPTYLIIEEINRGNCAQIFGDLFQLLDRNEHGVSEYTIKPDADLARYLADAGILSHSLSLPANFHIYATMNTSDQSLFPMDSAFKRRWSMKYIPINLQQEKAIKFIFTVNQKGYSWVQFLEKVNPLIRKATDSEDKQMGEFFIKGNTSEEDFINKVLFFLWNDICKDLYSASRISPNFFLRNTESSEKKDVFTFAELFGKGRQNEDGTYTSPTELLEGFLQHKLGIKPIAPNKDGKEEGNVSTDTSSDVQAETSAIPDTDTENE